jgi:hypothetical protein
MKMSKATLQSIVVHRPEPTTIKSKQHMCMDKGYDLLLSLALLAVVVNL